MGNIQGPCLETKHAGMIDRAFIVYADYNFIRCLVWIWIVVFHCQGRIYKDVSEYGAEKK